MTNPAHDASLAAGIPIHQFSLQHSETQMQSDLDVLKLAEK
jgi:primosomal replication protein N